MLILTVLFNKVATGTLHNILCTSCSYPCPGHSPRVRSPLPPLLPRPLPPLSSLAE